MTGVIRGTLEFNHLFPNSSAVFRGHFLHLTQNTFIDALSDLPLLQDYSLAAPTVREGIRLIGLPGSSILRIKEAVQAVVCHCWVAEQNSHLRAAF